MPAEYVKCVESYVKRGVSRKTAKARCAAAYYKRHGVTVNEAHKKGLAELPAEISDGLDFDLTCLMMSDLSEIGATIQATQITKTEMNGSVLDIKAINTDLIDDFGVVEIIATMVGAHAYTGDGLAVRWTEDALTAAQETWRFTRVSINHNNRSYGRVLASFLDGKLLRMVVKVDDTLKAWIKKAGEMIGVSIEAINVKIDEKTSDILSATGSGVTFVFPDHTPACTIDEGCGIVGADNIIKEEGTQVKEEDMGEVSSFIPPDAGTLPAEGKKILKKVYDECRSKQGGSEDPKDKEKCAAIAWTAVKNAGFARNETGKWGTTETTASLTNFDLSGTINVLTAPDATYYYPNITIPEPGGAWIPWITWPSDNTGGMWDIKTTPYNINEGVDSKDKTKEGEKLADETPKTICAEKHERLIKEKETEIETLKKKIESLESVVASYEAEKKSAMLDQLKAFIDVKPYEGSDIKTIDTVLGAMKAFKEKADKEPVQDSGATVKATADKVDETGKAMTNEISEAEKKAKEEAEKLDATWTEAERYGFKKPKK